MNIETVSRRQYAGMLSAMAAVHGGGAGVSAEVDGRDVGRLAAVVTRWARKWREDQERWSDVAQGRLFTGRQAPQTGLMRIRWGRLMTRSRRLPKGRVLRGIIRCWCCPEAKTIAGYFAR